MIAANPMPHGNASNEKTRRRETSPVASCRVLKEIVRFVANSRQHYFPVVDGKGRFLGIFSTDDVRSHLYNEEIWDLTNNYIAVNQYLLRTSR
jgi:CBS-domain-containing membrane protein